MNILRYLDFAEKYRKLLIILIIVFLISTSLCSTSIAVRVSISQSDDKDLDNTVDYDGYIIKFNEESLSVFERGLKNKMKYSFPHLSETIVDKFVRQKVLQHKNKLLSLHRKAKEDILKLMDNECTLGKIFSLEFIGLSNGITIKKVSNAILEKIRDLPYVKSIVPNYKIFAALDRSVPLINADDVWRLNDSYGRNIMGKGITLAILDTGVDYTHPDLKDNFLGGYDFANNDNDSMDDNGHGTHCAGIAVGTGNSSGYQYVGVAPDAKFYAFKVLDESGEGNLSTFLAGMDRAVDPDEDGDFSDHVDIISLSLGSEEPGDPDDDLSLKVDEAVDRGVVVVAAAGNLGSGSGTITSPGCARKVICVGATDKEYNVTSFSSRGPTSIGTVKPDVVAPGVHIASTRIGGGYTNKSGTSMATPHVAGTAALIMQAHPNWTPDEIKMALRNTAVDLGYSITTQGYGRIDALNAVNLSDAPPIAILNTSGEIEYGFIDIYGTAMADDFQNYSLYYLKDDKWIKRFENDEEVNDSTLFTWDTRSLKGGTYKLKLEVRSQNQTSIDIVFISIGLNVFECEHFTVKITNKHGNPTKAWILFTLPFHLPRIKYGSSVTFKAPLILNPKKESLDGRLIVFKIFGSYGIIKMDVTVVNKN